MNDPLMADILSHLRLQVQLMIFFWLNIYFETRTYLGSDAIVIGTSFFFFILYADSCPRSRETAE